MEIVTTRAVVQGFWDALRRPIPKPNCRSGEASRILAAAARDGWIALMEIESFMLGTDPGPYHLRTVELLQMLRIPPKVTFPRPRSGQREVLGVERVEVHDFAQLLMFLERAGLQIDPAPLCEMLRPALLKERYVTQAQLAVLWHERERHRLEPITLTTPCRLNVCESHPTHVTATGYVARACGCEGPSGEAALRIAPPRRHASRLAA